MIMRRWGLLFAGALTMLCAVLAAPHHDPGELGRAIVSAHAAAADLYRLDADLKASIALFEALESKDRVPGADRAWSVAAVSGDGKTMTDRLSHIEDGGRVKSASSLVVAPASRFSART